MLNKFSKWIGVVVLMGLLVLPAWGGGVIFNCNGTGGSGFVYESGLIKLSVGNALQFIKGNKSCPNPAAGYLSGGNVLLGQLGTVGEGTGGELGTFNRVESLATGTVYVRAWNSIAPGEGKNVKYGYSAYGQASSGNAPPQAFPVPSFVLNYIAYAPESPTLLPVAEGEVGFDTAKLRWGFKEGYEITDVEIRYGTKMLGGLEIDTSTGGIIGISGAPTSYQFPSYPQKNSLSPNKTYYAQVTAKNYFAGEPGKSNIVSFATVAVPASEVGKVKKLGIKTNNDNSITLNYEGSNADAFEIYRSTDQGITWIKINETKETSFTDNTPNLPLAYYRVKAKNGIFAEATVAKEVFDFTKLEAAGKKYTGINSFSIPFLPNGKAVNLADRWNLTADGLANYIKARKGDIVEFIGGWDAQTQKSYGRVYKAGAPFSGAKAAEDFPLQLNKGYQIGVSQSTSLTMVGEIAGEQE